MRSEGLEAPCVGFSEPGALEVGFSQILAKILAKNLVPKWAGKPRNLTCWGSTTTKNGDPLRGSPFGLVVGPRRVQFQGFRAHFGTKFLAEIFGEQPAEPR